MHTVPHSQRATVALRAAILYTVGLGLTACGFFFIILPSLLLPNGKVVAHKLLRYWARLILFIGGVRLVVVGGERVAKDQPTIFPINHSSWWDIPIVAAALPCDFRFVAMDELEKIPVVGAYLKLTGHFLMSRKQARKARETTREVRAALKVGVAPAIAYFPEGRLSRSGSVHAFKGGAFHLAREGGFTLQPVAIVGAYRLWPWYSRFPLCGGTVEVRIGAPEPQPKMTCKGSACLPLAQAFQARVSALMTASS